MKGDLRCIDGRLFRHDPQYDDPELETDIGECPDCSGEGWNCADCDAPHSEEHWDDYVTSGPGTPIRKMVLHLCESCADARRERSVL